MKQGVILFAFNNKQIDYVKQAVYCAKRIKKYLNLPVQLITDNEEYLIDAFPFYKNYIDIVTPSTAPTASRKTFYDGIYSNRGKLEWKNSARDCAFDLTEFDQTLVLDTDLLISNDKLLTCFNTPEDFMIANDYNLVNENTLINFDRVSDKTIPMYWATILYFTKSKTSETIFNFVQHIKENYNYYRLIYSITERKFRNDFAFSIAIHTMRGFVEDCRWPTTIPSDMWVSTDRDILLDVKDSTIKLLTNKDNDYTAVKIKDATTHVMNKFSLNSFIDKEFTNE